MSKKAFVLRIPEAMHQRIKERAFEQGISINQWMTQKLQTSDAYATRQFQEPIQEVMDAFGNALVGIVVFGSFVRDQMHSSSDVDWLLVMQGQPIERGLYRQWATLNIDDRHSPQFVQYPDAVDETLGSLWLEVAMEGKVLWERGVVLSLLLSKIRYMIVQRGWTRHISHGHPYWVKA
jgi:hypothetical protein